LTILLVLVCALAGCSFPSPAAKNEIRPLRLTEREQNLIDLIGANAGEILLFEYDVSEPCVRFEVWVEVYENGELAAEKPGGISMSGVEPQPWKGTLAISIDQVSEGTVWNFTVASDEGGRGSHESSPYPDPEGITSSAMGTLDDTAPVEIGKEIVLYSKEHGFNKNGTTTVYAYDEQEYVNNPESIKNQEYLHLIKCRFSNEV
jgi:hypothetical protein